MLKTTAHQKGIYTTITVLAQQIGIAEANFEI